MCSPTYTFTNGRFQIEEKKMIKSRLGFSPDKADALCLTFALPELRAGSRVSVPTLENQRDMAAGRALTEWDPLQELEKSDIYGEMVREIEEDEPMPTVEVI